MKKAQEYYAGDRTRAGMVRGNSLGFVLVEPPEAPGYTGRYLWWRPEDLEALEQGALDRGPYAVASSMLYVSTTAMEVLSPQVGLTLWNRLQQSAAAATCAALFREPEAGLPEAKKPKEDKMDKKNEVTGKAETGAAAGLAQEFQEAVVEGAKTGAAASVAGQVVALVKQTAGVHWPKVADTQVGMLVTPILLCLALAYIVVVVPGVPKAGVIRRICILAAKGSAVVAAKTVADRWGDQIRTLAVQILGLGAANDIDGVTLQE